jgi:hypothetical protein
MMPSLLVMVEEQSAKEVLDIVLPKILPKGTHYNIAVHSGKGALRKSIPIKLRAWNIPDTKFVVLYDQDSAECVQLKNDLQSLCNEHREGVLVRIACVELEAWYFGDLNAVGKAYDMKKLSELSQKAKFREPDKIRNPKNELKKLIPRHQQIIGAKRIAPHMNIAGNTSQSFNAFVTGVQSLFQT